MYPCKPENKRIIHLVQLKKTKQQKRVKLVKTTSVTLLRRNSLNSALKGKKHKMFSFHECAKNIHNTDSTSAMIFYTKLNKFIFSAVKCIQSVFPE